MCYGEAKFHRSKVNGVEARRGAVVRWGGGVAVPLAMHTLSLRTHGCVHTVGRLFLLSKMWWF